MSEENIDVLGSALSGDPDPEVIEEPVAVTPPEPVKAPEPEEPRVPYRRVEELVGERERLKEQISQLRQRIEESARQPEPPKPQAPSYEEDPLEHLRSQNSTLAQEVAQLKAVLTESAQQTRAQQSQQAMLSQYQSAWSGLANQDTAFRDAYQWWVQSRVSEREAAGLSRQEAEQSCVYEEARLAELALRKGDNPAEKIYAAARARGWKAPPPIEGAADRLEKGLKAAATLGPSQPVAREQESEVIDFVTSARREIYGR